MTAGQTVRSEASSSPRLMESEVDGFSVYFWSGDTYRGDWQGWIDWDKPGDLPPEELELWALVRALRATLIALYGYDGSHREHFDVLALPPWERQVAA